MKLLVKAVLQYQASAALAVFCCLPGEVFPIDQLIATPVLFTVDKTTGAKERADCHLH